MSDSRYYVKKGGGPQDHRNLANAIKEYIEKQSPGAKIGIQTLPERPDRISSVIVTIDLKDPAYARRLLGDRRWPFHLDTSVKGSNPPLVLDTREVGRIDPFTMVERDVIGIGDSAPDLSASGSIGHEFIKAGNDLGKIKDSPPLAQVKPIGFRLRFQKGEDSIRFREGFRSDEAQAYSFGAQIELQLAKKAMKGGDVEAARAHLEFAKANLASASEFNAPILYHFQEKKTLGLEVGIEGLSTSEVNRLKDWSRQLQKKLEILEKEIGELAKNEGFNPRTDPQAVH